MDKLIAEVMTVAYHFSRTATTAELLLKASNPEFENESLDVLLLPEPTMAIGGDHYSDITPNKAMEDSAATILSMLEDLPHLGAFFAFRGED